MIAASDVKCIYIDMVVTIHGWDDISGVLINVTNEVRCTSIDI